MGVDIAGFGLIFLAMLAGFIPGIIIGIWIVSHRNYAAWKKKKKQVRRQIEKSRKALDKAKKKDIAGQEREFRKEQKKRRKEERRNAGPPEADDETDYSAPEPEDTENDTVEHTETEREDNGINKGAPEPSSDSGESAADGTPGRKPKRIFGWKKKKGTLLENRMQTCISDMSFECAENGTSEKEVAREFQKKQDDAYRI